MNFLKHAKRLPVLDWNLNFFGAHEQSVDSKWSVPEERHYAFECIFVIEGIEHIQFKDRSFTLSKGDLCLIPPEYAHTVNAVSTLTYFCFHFDIDDPNVKAQLIRNIKVKIKKDSQLNNLVAQHITKLDSLVTKSSFDFSTKMTIQIELSKILQIFYENAIIAKGSTRDDQKFDQIEHARIIADHIKNTLTDQIYNYLKGNILIEDKYTVKDAIDFVGFSTGYGTQIFKKTYGISPREYLTKLKINEGKKLLLKPNITVEAISLALGYTNVSNFSRQFKRWTGFSPLNYRKQMPSD